MRCGGGWVRERQDRQEQSQVPPGIAAWWPGAAGRLGWQAGAGPWEVNAAAWCGPAGPGLCTATQNGGRRREDPALSSWQSRVGCWLVPTALGPGALGWTLVPGAAESWVEPRQGPPPALRPCPHALAGSGFTQPRLLLPKSAVLEGNPKRQPFMESVCVSLVTLGGPSASVGGTRPAGVIEPWQTSAYSPAPRVPT